MWNRLDRQQKFVNIKEVVPMLLFFVMYCELLIANNTF